MLERQKTAGNRTIPHILHHLWASGVMSPLCEVDNLTLQTHAPHDYMSSHEQTWQVCLLIVHIISLILYILFAFQFIRLDLMSSYSLIIIGSMHGKAATAALLVPLAADRIHCPILKHQTCLQLQRAFSGVQIMSWDLHAATAFVTDFYPWFLPVFLKYDNDIRQAEAVKPLILHKLGGVHLKSHSQCIRPADVFEQNTTDAILQVSVCLRQARECHP